MRSSGGWAILRSLTRVDQEFVDLARQRARFHLDQGRFDAALTEIDAGLALEPEDSELLGLRAAALLDLDRPEESLEAANRGLSFDPEAATLHLLASMALVRLGQHGYAIAAAEETVRLAPSYPEAHRQLARAHAATGRSGSAAARVAAHRALQLAPEEADSHIAVVDSVLLKGVVPKRRDLALAEEHARAALELEPGSEIALNALARIQMARWRPAAAAGTLSRAVAESPQEQVLHANMDVALSNNIAMAHWALFLSVFVLTKISALGDRGQSILIAVLSLAAVGFISLRLLGQVRTARTAYLRGLARRQPLIALWALLLVGVLVCFVARVVVPTASGPLLAAGVACLLGGAALSWIAYFRNKSSAPARG